MSLIYDIQNQFINACHVGDSESVQAILEIGLSLDPPLNIHAYQEQAFRHCCHAGFLELAQTLYNFCLLFEEPIDIHMVEEDAFRGACANGKLETAQWLYNISFQDDNSIDVNSSNYFAFITACTESHIKVALWLDEICDYDAPVYNQAFCRCIYKENHQSIIWLLERSQYKMNISKTSEKYKLDTHYWQEFPFRSACANGHLELAKLLLEYGDSTKDYIDIYAGGDESFRKAVQNNHIETAIWLTTLTPAYWIIYSDDMILESGVSDEFQDVKELAEEHDPSLLDRLGFQEYVRVNRLPECVLCTDDNGDYILELPCGHTHCADCLILWGLKNRDRRRKCSYCQKPFRWSSVKVLEMEFVIRI